MKFQDLTGVDRDNVKLWAGMGVTFIREHKIDLPATLQVSDSAGAYTIEIKRAEGQT